MPNYQAPYARVYPRLQMSLATPNYQGTPNYNDPTLAPWASSPAQNIPSYGMFGTNPKPNYGVGQFIPPPGEITPGFQLGARVNLFRKGWRSIRGGDGKYYWVPPGQSSPVTDQPNYNMVPY